MGILCNLFGCCGKNRNDSLPFNKSLSVLQLKGLCEYCIPTVLKDCIEYLSMCDNIIKKNLLNEKAKRKQIQMVMKRIANEKPPQYDRTDVAVAVLKRFLRELPTDFCSDQMRWLMVTQGFTSLTDSRKRMVLMHFVHEQPHRIRTNLTYIMRFLSAVHSVQENEMDALDIARVFAPVMIRQQGKYRAVNVREGIKIMAYFIEHYDDIMLVLGGFESTSKLRGRRFCNVFSNVSSNVA